MQMGSTFLSSLCVPSTRINNFDPIYLYALTIKEK